VGAPGGAGSPLIFRKGLDRKREVALQLAEDYHSDLVAAIKRDGYVYRAGRIVIHLAREFGFCYGVDRAVDYAYQARVRFPDRRIFLTGEIIHNPHVNDQLRSQGVRFLSDPGESAEEVAAEDVVILPAFGVAIDVLERFVARGCTLVDTTCGSVLNVWKNVTRYTAEGITSIIHGKYWHEETRATASQARQHGRGHYLVVLDRAEAQIACDYIRHGGDRAAFIEAFGKATSPGFDPDVHLQRVGCANQTTMLSSESLEVGQLFRAAILERYGPSELPQRFRAFDTICSATQDRQDAVIALLGEQRLDLMLVLGGHNSSNTYNLARICASKIPTYHVAEPSALVSADEILHRPVDGHEPAVSRGWLAEGPLTIGLTAGASTPDTLVGAVIRRLDALANESAIGPPEIVAEGVGRGP
jgi:4-hydroxy-3-methylbut-2-enyl diphosphate reductase